MNFDEFWKRSVACGAACALGLFAAAFFYDLKVPERIGGKEKPASQIAASAPRGGTGSSGDDYGPDDPRNFRDQTQNKPEAKQQPVTGVRILTKPRAVYTDAARANQVQGKVVLRVTFKADGTIGAIATVAGLPDGLTEAAIAAAKDIEFEPARRGDTAFSVTKPVEYIFTIY